MTAARRNDLYPELEGMRGVMCLFVLFCHMDEMVHWPLRYADGGSPWYWAWGCMEIFFCISGFCITRNLLRSARERSDWALQYVKKRALRVWPAYYVALAVCIAVSYWVHDVDAPYNLRWQWDWAYLLKTVFFAQFTEAYYGPISEAVVPTFWHSWSVALEEQFYILILLVMLLRQRYSLFAGNRILLPILLLLPLGQLARHSSIIGWTLLGRPESFLLGIALAVLEPACIRLKERMDSMAPGRRIVASLLLATGALPLLIPYLSRHGDWSAVPLLYRSGFMNPYLAFGLLGMGLIASCVVAPVTPLHRALRLPVCRYLGERSYSVYLFHIPVLLVLKQVLRDVGAFDTWTFWSLGVASVVLTSMLTYRTIEMPFLAMKARLSRSPGANVPQVAAGAAAS